MTDKKLIECIRRIKSGDWTFIQLRGESLSEKDINNGDVDFLCPPTGVQLFLAAACQWVKEGLCHIHVSTRKTRKVAVRFFSVDGTQSLLLDLWKEVPQIYKSNKSFRFSDFVSVINSEAGGVTRLPIKIEARVYIHHLKVKRKKIKLKYIQERLFNYLDHLEPDDILRTDIKEILDTGDVRTEILDRSFADIQKEVGLLQRGSSRFAHMHSTTLKPHRNSKFLCIMGCDGVGKTTLSNSIIDRTNQFTQVFTGKHLYRKWFLYKLCVIFVRPLTFSSRETFDEKLSFLTYILACINLRFKMLFEKSYKIVDRNIVDFLCVDRKTNTPAWSKFKFLRNILGVRVPTIHCVASYEKVSSRKNEMTELGHAKYDEMIFTEMSNRVPTEYTVFNNSGALEESTLAILNIINSEFYPILEKFKANKKL